MHHHLPIFHAQETESETNQPAALKCAEPNAACFFRGHTHGQRQHVPVGQAPNFLLKGFNLPQIVKAVQIADHDGGFGLRFGHVGGGPPRAFNIRDLGDTRQCVVAATSVAAHEAHPPRV